MCYEYSRWYDISCATLYVQGFVKKKNSNDFTARLHMGVLGKSDFEI